jgi:2-hydroxychromene-2-carboxylate isomerase
VARVDYYLTLNSPWAYLGARKLAEIVQRKHVQLVVKPARFAEVFAKTGGLPLDQRPPERRAYRMMELKRWRDFHGVPLVLTPKFAPADEAAGVRLVIAAAAQGADAARLALEIGRAQRELDENIADAQVLAAAATRAGLDAAQIRAAGPSDADLDAIWAQNTAEAIARGVFGAPSYVLESGEIFWGQDRLEFLDRALAHASH